MEAEFRNLCLEDNKITYPYSKINRTALDFSGLIISDKTKPLEGFQNQWAPIRTEAAVLNEVPDSGSWKKSMVEQPTKPYRTSATLCPTSSHRPTELASLETKTKATGSSCSERSELDWREHDIMDVEGRFDEIIRLQGKIKEKMQQRFSEGRVCLQKRIKEKTAMRSTGVKIKKNKKVSTGNAYLKKHHYLKEEIRAHMVQLERSLTPIFERVATTGHRNPESIWSMSGKVRLSDILKKIVNNLCENFSGSHLFLKTVTAKEALGYFDVVRHPMDLSTIRSNVNRMEYDSSKEFRFDVWKITYNADRYNKGQNPSISLLGDQLMALCDQLLEEHKIVLAQAEAEIGLTDYSDLWV